MLACAHEVMGGKVIRSAAAKNNKVVVAGLWSRAMVPEAL